MTRSLVQQMCESKHHPFRLLILAGVLSLACGCTSLVEENNKRIELERGTECINDDECIDDLVCESDICVEYIDGNANAG